MLEEFFQDAREQLVGSRPEPRSLVATPRDHLPPQPADSGDSQAFAWSAVIDADNLETEIKHITSLLNQDLKAPAQFKAGGYLKCRGHFSLLAVLFWVASQYDGPVRWQDAAPGLQQLFSRTGYNLKVGTDQTFQDALQRKEDLETLIRGGRPNLPENSQQVDWSRVADRPPLMQRLGLAYQDRLAPWVANGRTFRRNRDQLRHEAQIVAMLAKVIQMEGYDFADDETYLEYAGQLGNAAREIVAAANDDDYERTREAVGRMNQACNDCHDGYRE